MTSSEPDPSSADLTFGDLQIHPSVLQAVGDVGYESPSAIQAATIPAMMAGSDVVGLAQTGTGKTAAFAIPILSKIDPRSRATQALVLAPTRELALQVAEAFGRYGAHLPEINVLPIYGGAPYGPQLGGLKRGAQVVVGTPGRVIDHLEKGSLDLTRLDYLVLDEDAFDVLREAHLEHLVGLVEHQVIEPGQIESPALEVVDDPARRADHDLRAAPQPRQLHAVGRAAVDRQHVDAGRCEPYRPNASATCNANSRVGASTSAWVACCGVDLGQDRDREGGGLSGPGLGQPDDVGAGHHRRDGRGLDGRRRLVSDVDDGLQHRRVNLQVCEGQIGAGRIRFGGRHLAGSLVVDGAIPRRAPV